MCCAGGGAMRTTSRLVSGLCCHRVPGPPPFAGQNGLLGGVQTVGLPSQYPSIERRCWRRSTAGPLSPGPSRTTGWVGAAGSLGKCRAVLVGGRWTGSQPKSRAGPGRPACGRRSDERGPGDQRHHAEAHGREWPGRLTWRSTRERPASRSSPTDSSRRGGEPGASRLRTDMSLPRAVDHRPRQERSRGGELRLLPQCGWE